ncbi:hypothetical protein BFF98_09855 [Corynebacterium pseudotuberculosis]|nr:hypothetical protein ATN03_08410 [Corynebacterium pseudotuberculosis]AMN73829.1 hypothetical protein ATN04_05380 [Corynebacterium pseudotuberculosis]AMN75426.1 hypothetical protein ATN05_03215 [Corynebacterium pseudotuberculosis]ANZ91572.1 hypothetical protein CPMB20_03210 [Corynebacterium pseudotuberculosis]OMH65241.1 hypothetical protein BFG02_10520 [Corynebacterium pseudotuberculosis]
MTLSASLVAATASYSAFQHNPSHPLVGKHSTLGGWFFAIAFIIYLASFFLLVTYEAIITAATVAFLGLVVTLLLMSQPNNGASRSPVGGISLSCPSGL